MSGESNDSDILAKLMICFIGAASAAVVITIYHCIATRDIRVILRRGIIIRRRLAAPPSSASAQQHEYQSSVENSMAELIPVHKYQKGRENDGVCAVCLSEFEDGEELRTLPECMHSFHVACIDMWLYSHTNCPVCRTEATPPSPHVIVHVPAPAPSRPARLTNTMPMFISGVIQ